MSDEKRKRPKRKAIPVRVKREVCERQKGVCVCGCGASVHWKPRSNTHFDHEPALRLREVNAEWTDYIPPQWSAEHIDARCPDSHHAKTHGTGATTAGTDTGKIKKERKRAKPVKPKQKIRSHGFQNQGKTKWPKRKFPKRPKT